jgi:hypothetical protein
MVLPPSDQICMNNQARTHMIGGLILLNARILERNV